MRTYRFVQVDVFGFGPFTGNPLQEAADGAAIPLATAPLVERLRRFAK